VKYTTHATVKGAPKFEVRAHAEPIAFRCGCAGSLRARVGPVQARVGTVPIRLAVPFLGRLQTVGAVGPFDLRLEHVDVALEELELRCEGVLGGEGLDVGLEGGVGCELQIDVQGTLPGRVRRAQLEFSEPEEPYEQEEES
jgi:hypothetical protein